MVEPPPTSTVKEEADAEFRAGNFLKAAALYTKAIKLDPGNAVLYSNRSVALLKLKKIAKALEDAEECIRLRPEWEKGYFRKAAVHEAQENMTEALEVYQVVLSLSPENKEVITKIKTLERSIQKKEKPFCFGAKPTKPTTDACSADAAAAAQEPSAPPSSSAPAPTNPASAEKPAAAAPGPAASPSASVSASSASPPEERLKPSQEVRNEDLGSPEIAAFVQEFMAHLASEAQDPEVELLSMVHFLPGSPSEPFEEQETHIRASSAFDSPETLGGFVDFVRQAGSRLDAHAVLSVVPRSLVAYPQTWSKPGWPCGKSDGVFVQLEARVPRRLKKLWFVPLDLKTRSVEAPWSGLDPEVFGLMPAVLR